MLTETGSIKTYQEHLTILPILDLGIGRIRKLLCWPEENEPSHLATYLPCFYESYLRDNGKEPTSFLTHDEAFDFLCALGHIDTRNSIDHYNRLPSNAYTGVINSIHTQDKTAFSAALKETDCQDLMRVLWTMRYLLFDFFADSTQRVLHADSG